MNGTHIKRLGVVVLVAGLVLVGFGSVGFESATVNRDTTSASVADTQGNASLAVELESESFSEPVNESFHLLNVTNNLESKVGYLQVDVDGNLSGDDVVVVESVGDSDDPPLNETETAQVFVSCERDTAGPKEFDVTVTGKTRATAVRVQRSVSINCGGSS